MLIIISHDDNKKIIKRIPQMMTSPVKQLLWIIIPSLLSITTKAFKPPSLLQQSQRLHVSSLSAATNNNDDDTTSTPTMSRRSALRTVTSASGLASGLLLSSANTRDRRANAEDSSMYSPKFVQAYEDFILTEEGWSYKDVKVGASQTGRGDGELIKDGDRVVFDWSGYTIGYFGRPFEAKGGPQGGAFDKELDFARTVIGSHTIIPGLECALRTMKPGGIRQVIIPYGPLSYPDYDLEHEKVGPKPATFSGQRALNFVLENPRVDRTLLFNVKLIRVDRGDGKGGFIRG
mmetsp:Transcript_8287/g.16578  ORF Transcript_8287/g.16578 Transcript_8287/m.16578 type:complete len:290 (+) Transcript_8287:84-953(+)